MLILAVGLLGLRLPPYTPVLDLERKLRCRECGARDADFVVSGTGR